MTTIKTTNNLLLFIIIPLVFYILNILSFIFIPLILSMFLSLLFLPLMRWLKKKNVPKVLSIILVIIIIFGILRAGGFLLKITSQEILSTKEAFFLKAELKLTTLVLIIEDFFGIAPIQDENVLLHFFKSNFAINDFSFLVNKIGNTLSMSLMTLFFSILWLSESVNFQKVLNSTILKQKHSSIKAFIKIEKDIITFIKVKVLISFFTGVGISIACVLFDVSFPIFWGLFAFIINFVQMVGSFICVILLALFAFVELEPSTALLFFVISITGVQVLFGSILEPIFMGKSFSINVILILIMLMLWGFIFGIPGMIMAIPITVFLKIIFEQFERTKVISELLS